MGTQTQRTFKLWSWWLPNAHDDRVKCYSRSQGTNVKIIWKVLLQSLWYDVSCTANAGFRLTCHSPLCRYAAWSSLAVSELQLSAATPLWPYHRRSGIAPELNRIQLSAICRGGQSGKVIDLLAWRCLPLGHPSAASGACAVEQISSSKRQCGKRQVSLKPA